jgi:hypothetical protein
MMRRFSSGSETPSSLSRKRSAASTTTRFMPNTSRNTPATSDHLARTQHAVVHEDGGEVLADGLVQAEAPPPRNPPRPKARRSPFARPGPFELMMVASAKLCMVQEGLSSRTRSKQSWPAWPRPWGCEPPRDGTARRRCGGVTSPMAATGELSEWAREAKPSGIFRCGRRGSSRPACSSLDRKILEGTGHGAHLHGKRAGPYSRSALGATLPPMSWVTICMP